MTATLAPKQRALYASDASRQSFWGHTLTTNDDGSTSIEGIEIFKVGTFRDSMGEEMTWEIEHLQQMAANFDLLKSKGIFPNVPVREDHSFSVTKVIGYFENVRVKDDRLLADVRITEPAGADKIARGTYRSVSNEVGFYETNDGAMYWPVVYGFAYVDLPAVEGLHNANTNGISVFSRTSNKEALVATPDKVDDKAPEAPAATPHQFRIAGQTTIDYVKVQEHIDSVETRNAALEATAKAADEKFRKDFVQSLVDKKVLAAPQKDATEKFALDLSAESFEAWRGTWEHAPAIALLGEHGVENRDPSGKSPTEAEKLADEIQVCKDTLAYSKRAGMSAEKLARHPAQIKLNELTKNTN